MYKELFDVLKNKEIKLVSAESITGGSFISNIIKIPGASEIIHGAFICYSNEYKYEILNVDRNIEIVSEEMANQLAINSFNKSNLNNKKMISISFTGNASKEGIENKLQGLTYVSIYDGNNLESLKFISSKKSREEIILDTANFGTEEILKFIEKNSI